MMGRVRVMMSILTALLVAAWFSPCCCQSAWISSQLAGWFTSASDDAGCCCKKKQHRDHGPRDCCPVDGKNCKQSGAKLATAKPNPDAVSVCAWLLAEPIYLGPVAEHARGVLRDEPPWPPGPDLTLLGLHCALVI